MGYYNDLTIRDADAHTTDDDHYDRVDYGRTTARESSGALTEYQAGQLLHIHFTGELKYRTDAGTRVPSAQWRKMVDTLVKGGYVNTDMRITDRGRAYLNANHLNIKALN
jgi:hypothetical protein